MANMKNILVISAHADDHLLCAGTIFKLQKEKGFIPFEIVLTDSSRGQDFKQEKQTDNLQISTTRLKELSEASQLLGVKETFLLSQPDYGLEYKSELVLEVAKIIRKVRPQVVFLMGEEDMHPDHRAAFRIGLEAIKFASFDVETKTLGDFYRVPIVLCNDQEIPGKVNVLVDISKYVDKKKELMKVYQSQMSPSAVAFSDGLDVIRGYHLTNNEIVQAEAFKLQDEFFLEVFSDDMGLF